MNNKTKRKLRADCVVRKSHRCEDPYLGFNIDLTSTGPFHIDGKLPNLKQLKDFLYEVTQMGRIVRITIEEKLPKKKRSK